MTMINIIEYIYIINETKTIMHIEIIIITMIKSSYL